MLAGRSACNAIVESTSVNLHLISVVYQNEVSRASLELVQGEYVEHRGVHSSPNVGKRESGADGASLKELLE